MHKGNTRFGSYLRSLRCDRRLTLERIEELSARDGEPVSKTYLSRCEHGQTHPTLPRLEVLARLYKIRLGELAERFELERRIERGREGSPEASGPPEAPVAEEPSLAAERGIEAAGRGDPHDALVLFDASRRLLACADEPAPPGAAAVADPEAAAAGLPPGAGDGEAAGEPRRIAEARSRLCLAVLSSSIGNHRVSKEEAESLVCADDLPDEIRHRASIQLAGAWRHLRRGRLARLLLGDLLAHPERLPERVLADAHFLTGSLDLDDGSPRPALLHLRKAVALYRSSGAPADLCRSLMELGEAYRAGGQVPEAMVRYQEGLALARRADIKSLVCDLLSHLGRGHYLLGHHAPAAHHLYESNDLARRGDYFEVLFRNFFYLRAIAAARGDDFSRRTAERSLRTLLARCSALSAEAVEFRAEMARRGPAPEAGPGLALPATAARRGRPDSGKGVEDRRSVTVEG